MSEDVRLIGNICGSLFLQLDTSKICEAHSSVYCKTVLCRGECLAQWHTPWWQNRVVCLLFGKSVKCGCSGLPQVLSVRAPPQKGPLLLTHPPTQPPTNTHICNMPFFFCQSPATNTLPAHYGLIEIQVGNQSDPNYNTALFSNRFIL